MNRVKSEARKQAWKPSDGNFNPWAKWGGQRPSQSDPEKADYPAAPQNQTSEAEAIGVLGAPPNMHVHGGMGRHSAEKETHPDGIAPVGTPEDHSPTSRTMVNGSDENSDNSRASTLPVAGNPRANSTTSATTKRRRGKFVQFLKHKKNDDAEEEQPVERTTSRNPQFKQNYTVWGQARAAVFGSWINILLVCVPIGIALGNTPSVNGIITFVINFLAIIPLAGILSYSTEEISLRVGETLGGLLNASFGNAVELIVSIIALAKNEIVIVKTSLIGSMLSNLLLVLGMCFFFGGLRREQQYFNVTVAQTASSLLALAVGSLVIPTIFVSWGNAGTSELRESKIPQLSRGVAICLLFVYACYLYFQLKTHATMFSEPSQKVPVRKSSKLEPGAVHRGIAAIGAGTGAQAAGSLFGNKENGVFDPRANQEKKDDEDDVEVAQLSWIGAIVTLCISTAFVGVCAEYMVDGISAVTRTGNVSPEFIGLILIPIVGNAAEHATAVTVAIKDKMDLAIGVAIGSSLQIALFVLQLMVIIGWIMGREGMTLEFDG